MRETAASHTKNCLLRLDTSMVSRSITCISFTQHMTRFLSTSQPMPPAPTTSTGLPVALSLGSWPSRSAR
jgi:hypothetical protein